MDQTLFNLMMAAFGTLTTIAGFFGAWVLKIIWESVQESRKNHVELNARVTEVNMLLVGSYVSRDRFESELRNLQSAQMSHASAVFAKLDRIEDKCDRKADKP